MTNRGHGEPFRFPDIPDRPSSSERLRAGVARIVVGIRRNAVATTFVVGVATIAFCHYVLAIG